MARYLHLITCTARPLRLGVCVFLIGSASLPLARWADAATANAPNPAAAADAGAEPPALPADSPEMTSRATLLAYLQKLEPKLLDSLSADNWDRATTTSRIKLFEQTNRTQELTEAYLYYLTKLAPDPKQYVEILSHLAAVLDQRQDEAGLLTLVFELADNFPDGAQPVQQIRLVQAQYLLRLGQPEAALMILHQLYGQPEVTPPVHMVATELAGYIHERLGQPDEAVDAYLQAGADLAVGPQANEAVLRASLLLLELGQQDKSLAALDKLRGVPADIMSQSTGTEPVIKELLNLASEPDRARAYWSYQEKWLPQWRALAKTLGVKPDDPGQPLLVAYIENYAQLGQQSRAALAGGNAGTFFQIVDLMFRSGRWRPTDLSDAVGLLYQGISLAPAHTDEILAFGEFLEKNLPPAEQDLLEQLTQLRVAELVDHDKADVGRDAAQAVLQKYHADNASGQALARLYGYAVLKSNSYGNPKYGLDAANILADTLKDPAAHGNQRALAVLVLSNLYMAIGRDSDAQTLLENEIPKVIDPNDPSAGFWTENRTTLTTLKQQRIQAAGLDAGLKAWWEHYRLPWFDYATTKPQAEPLTKADDPAVEIARDFSTALDNTVSLPMRVATLEAAWDSYPEMFLTGSALVDATTDFARRQDLPSDLRYQAWSRAVLHLLWTGQSVEAEKLLGSAPSGSATQADDQADFDLWIEYLAQPNTVAAQQAFAEKVMALPIVRRAAALIVVRIVNSLANLDAADTAQAIFDQLGSAKLDDGAKQQYLGIRDTIKPMVESAKAIQPMADALRQAVLDAHPEAATAQLPKTWLSLNDSATPELSLLTQAEVGQGLLVVIRDHLAYGRHPLQAYLDYGETLSFNPADAALRMKFFETAQKLAVRDEDRFYGAMFMSVVDFDDVAVARRGWADLAPARTAAFPKTGAFILYYDALMKWRTGDPVDFATIFGPLDAKDLDPYKLRLALDYYIQHEDRAALQKVIDARPVDDFLQMPVLTAYIRALHLLSRDAALTRATDAAHFEISKAVVQSWARPDIETADSVFELARALNDPAAYPREWLGAMQGAMRNEDARDLLRMSDSRLQADWAGVLEAVNDYLARNATNYDAYWFKAQALINLNRRPEALDPLRTYVKYSKNDDDYPQAADLLKKIEAETSAKK